MTASPWIQSASGRPIDLVDPVPEEVEFREIADVLSRINRYSGNSVKPVSVALHTLIACDAAPDEIKPYVLLHDAHEARIGDITTPVVAALDAIVGDIRWSRALVSTKIAELKRRHDRAIFAAAGLAWPSLKQQAAVGHADLVAMQTERRDFLARPRRPWAIDGAEPPILPLARVYRLRAAPDVADELHARFLTHLPAFAGASPKGALYGR